MNWKRALFGLTTFGLLASSAMGCSSSTEEDDSEDALTDQAEPGQWVVDMKKVTRPTNEGGYGRSTSLFFGMSAQEYLCKPDESAESCARKPAVWDQAFRFGPKVSEGGVEFRKPYANDKVNPIVKLADASGTLVGPKGKGLNIIPLLKNTDPASQVHLRKWLKNGDVLAFFHPEYSSMRQLMDRRASHVAMHYDYKSPLNGKEYVHHIDNPNNYGPRYNYPPSRNMPFHVFRYQPKGMEAPKAEAYALAARNWAFLNDDLSPFADFFDLQLQTTREMKTKFVDRLLQGHESAEVYCSGLAYTNLNLGTNHPLKPGMLTIDYRREETGEVFKAEDCRSGGDNCVLSPSRLGSVSVDSLESRNKLVFAPYTTSELANQWLDNTYGELPFEKRAEIAALEKTQQQVGQGLRSIQWSDDDGKPGAAATPASAVAPQNLKAWGDSYGASLVMGKALKEGNAEAAAAAGKAFADSHSLVVKDGTELSIAALVTKHNASQPQDADPEKWVKIDVTQMTPAQVLKALEMAHVQNQFVPPRIWMDTADDRAYLPSGFDPRTESKADIVYVGTVINCELLSSADGNADACAAEGTGIGGGMDEFSEGGADTSTYPHYAVANGGERTHRRFDSSTGPALMGKGTKISLRATTRQMSDVKFLLHTPALYAEGYTDFVSTLFANVPGDAIPADARQRGLGSMSVRDYDTACTAINKVAASQGQNGSCAPKRAIVLDPARSEEVARGDQRALASGAIPDAVYSFDLAKICRIDGGDSMVCPVVTQKPTGGWDFANVQEVSLSRTTRGLVAATMADVGATTESPPPPNDPANPNAARDERAYGLCSACGTGGAHFNQWTISIRNDR